MPSGYKRLVKKGDLFNNLEIIKEVRNKSGRSFLCKNIITKEESVKRLCHLVTGYSKGIVYKKEERPGYKHGMSKTRPWQIWMGIKARCLNKKEQAYKDYGGRGIKICDKWMNFKNFWDDMNKDYNDEMTIDRIDVNGDYCKENCRWATKQEQRFNKRNTKWVTYKGKKVNLMTLSKETGINNKLLYQRIFTYGWSIEKATSLKKHSRIKRGFK